MKTIREINVVINMPPIAWARPGEGIHGRYDTQKKIKTCVAFFIAKAFKGQPKIMGPVHLFITFFMPIPKSLPKYKHCSFHTKKPDIDNMLKLFCDTCNDVGIWGDDAQVCFVTMAKQYSSTPRTEVLVREIDEELDGGTSSRRQAKGQKSIQD